MESKFGKSSQGGSDAVANANLFFTVGSIDEGFAEIFRQSSALIKHHVEQSRRPHAVQREGSLGLVRRFKLS